MTSRHGVGAVLAAIALAIPGLAAAASASTPDPFSSLAIYDGEWTVRSAHPWSGAPPGATDLLTSRCHRYLAYFACEQTINGRTASLIVYTVDNEGRLRTRTIDPNGLAGGRGDLTLAGSHWTYLDKPPTSLQGAWSRTENFVRDHDHIRFEEYESDDEGRTWRLTNTGEESRRRT